ncbi:hypothetical protein [Rhodothermus profundi]|uniref:Uncharacterized protein n=1 Tax=Rhodothermus profundi TaxID=633813 RepID=A0A1M6TX41_9BACT|nr:hypothetical protein [Rhodothermus profundi]SHK61509.1 hypothetical protein SAMN04488087_1573 [Rhodothermus profundi]
MASHNVDLMPRVNGAAESPTLLPAGWRGLSRGQRLWRFIKSLYYASSPSWRLLKSGALFFFGFFCWAIGNLLHAYLPDVYWPNLLIVYGALLFWFGPLTHLVFVPHLLPWLRRQRRHRALHWLGGHFTATLLTVFFTTVVLLSLNPPDFVVLDVRGRLHGTSTQAAAELAAHPPELTCRRARHQITCTLTYVPATVTRIEVTSGPRRLLQLNAQETTFTLSEQDLTEVLGQREFRVTLYDRRGQQLREFVRTTAFL